MLRTFFGLLIVFQISVLCIRLVDKEQYGLRMSYEQERGSYNSPDETALAATEELNRAINDPVAYDDAANTNDGHYEYGAYIQKYQDSFGYYKFRYTTPHTDMQATSVCFDPTPSGRQIVDALMHKIAGQNPDMELAEARALAQRSFEDAHLSMTAHYQIGESGLIPEQVVALVHGHPHAYDGPVTLDRFYDASNGNLIEHTRPFIVSANKFSKLDIDFSRSRGLDFYLAAPNGKTWVVNPKGTIEKLPKIAHDHEIPPPYSSF